MPGNHRLGLNDREGRAPTRPEAHKAGPEQPVRRGQVNTPTPQHAALVAECQDLRLQSGPSPEVRTEGHNNRSKKGKHRDESLPAEQGQHQLSQFGRGFWQPQVGSTADADPSESAAQRPTSASDSARGSRLIDPASSECLSCCDSDHQSCALSGQSFPKMPSYADSTHDSMVCKLLIIKEGGYKLAFYR
jgi:hypothetical protein